MANKTKEYFSKMMEEDRVFQSKLERWKAGREAIVTATNGDKEALASWDEKKPVNPVTAGATKAYRAWMYGKTKEHMIEVFDHLWVDEVQDFVDTLRNAGIRRFVFTTQSTALMDDIHALVSSGCKMRGVKVIHRVEKIKTDDEVVTNEKEVNGILFLVGGKVDPATEEPAGKMEAFTNDVVEEEEKPAEEKPKKTAAKKTKKAA